MSSPCSNCGSDLRVYVDCDVYNGKYIEIPDGVTNGDLINKMFPKLSKTGVVMLDDLENIIATNINIHWWNEPYKKEG